MLFELDTGAMVWRAVSSRGESLDRLPRDESKRGNARNITWREQFGKTHGRGLKGRRTGWTLSV